MAFIFNKLNVLLFGAASRINTTFGRRFIVLHGVGIVINSTTVAGDDIVIESGVVIGAEKRKVPVIGHRVFLGSGAKVIGGRGISRGNNVSIGANAVVVHNVPDNVAVGGVPAIIIRHK